MDNMTLCWDCGRATGECSWSARLVPVEGWVAKPTKKTTYSGEESSYIVQECPQFVRDAIGHGAKRYKE